MVIHRDKTESKRIDFCQPLSIDILFIVINNKIRIYLCELPAVKIFVAPSQMLIQTYNDEISVRCHVVYKRIRIWICRFGSHKFGVTSQVQLWKLGVD